MSETESLAKIESNQKMIMPYTADILKDKHVLDIGSGNGITAQYLKEVAGSNIKLVDVKDIRAKHAKALPFTLASAENLPYKNNAFDVAHLQYVLHHLPPSIDIKDVIAEAVRVAKQNTIIVEETKNQDTDITQATAWDTMMNEKLHPNSNMPIHRFYTHRELLQAIPRANHVQSYLVSNGNSDNGFLERRVYIIAKS